MAAIAPIAIQDGQATPVTHTFNPVQTVPPTYSRNGVAGTPTVGEEQLMLSIARKTGGAADAINKARLTIKVPVLETLAGGTVAGYEAPPRVAYYLQANLEFLLPARSTEAQRKDLRVLLKNLCLDTQAVNLVDKLEAPY